MVTVTMINISGMKKCTRNRQAKVFPTTHRKSKDQN